VDFAGAVRREFDHDSVFFQVLGGTGENFVLGSCCACVGRVGGGSNMLFSFDHC
jgi:hypothetical protein